MPRRARRLLGTCSGLLLAVGLLAAPVQAEPDPSDTTTFSGRIEAWDGSTSTVGALSIAVYTYRASDGATQLVDLPFTITGDTFVVQDVPTTGIGTYVLQFTDSSGHFLTQFQSGAFTAQEAQKTYLSYRNPPVDVGTVRLIPSGQVVNRGVPVEGATAQMGHVIHASAGEWYPTNVSLAYTWLQDGAVIAGASKSTYTPLQPQVGHVISSRVTATAPGRSPGVYQQDFEVLPYEPQVVYPVAWKGAGSTSLTYSWHRNAGAASYLVRVRLNGVLKVEKSLTASSTTITGLKPATLYAVEILEKSHEGLVGEAAVRPASTTPVPPSKLRAGAVTRTSLRLAWNASPGAIRYSASCIKKGTTAGAASYATKTAVTLSKLKPGTTYVCRVKSIAPNDSRAVSSSSAPLTVKTKK